MPRHTVTLTTYEGDIPIQMEAARAGVADAAMRAAADMLEAEGLGPVSGDFAPHEVSELHNVAEYLIRAMAVNARALQEPEPVYFTVYDRNVEGPTTFSVTGNDAVEWRGEFARLIADPDVVSARVSQEAQTLAEYESRATVSERIRRRREARAQLMGDTATVTLYDEEPGATLEVHPGQWVVIDPTGRDLAACYVVGCIKSTAPDGVVVVTNDGDTVTVDRVAAVLAA